jgi:hypothetical protein
MSDETPAEVVGKLVDGVSPSLAREARRVVAARYSRGTHGVLRGYSRASLARGPPRRRRLQVQGTLGVLLGVL